MMSQQTRSESLFYYFRLEDQIPKDHLPRAIDEKVDLSFVRERVKDLTVRQAGSLLILRCCYGCSCWAISTGLPVNVDC